MNQRPPHVSVGLAVYNGERYLKETLESILAQTFGDFELVISDNGSTDGTPEICRAYAARDRRIRYYRHEQNRGASWNFNRVFELSSGKYFKWAACDDLCAPEYLARCVEVLERDPSVVLCHSRTAYIDEAGRVTGEYDLRSNITSPRAHERFRDLICIQHWCFQVYGVIRSEILRTTGLLSGYAAPDRVLLARLGLLGKFHEVPEYLFSWRRHPEQAAQIFRTRHSRAVLYDPALKGRILLPTWRLLLDYINVIREVPLSPNERIRCYVHLTRYLRSNRNWARLGMNVITAAGQILGREWKFRSSPNRS